MQLPKIQLPKVHLAVNVAGLATTVASGIGLFLVQNQGAVIAAVPAKDAMLTSLILAAIATFLPTKQPAQSQSQVSTWPAPPKS